MAHESRQVGRPRIRGDVDLTGLSDVHEPSRLVAALNVGAGLVLR